MKNLRTAPQILEHYIRGKNKPVWCYKFELKKAMREYALVRIEKEKEKIKDEMYEEARRNILEQYNLN